MLIMRLTCLHPGLKRLIIRSLSRLVGLEVYDPRFQCEESQVFYPGRVFHAIVSTVKEIIGFLL